MTDLTIETRQDIAAKVLQETPTILYLVLPAGPIAPAPDVISSRRDVEAHLVARARSDAAFLAELRADPRGVVERELPALLPGFIQLPASVTVTLLEETETTRYVVLPPKPPAEDGELSDLQLEAVAGGAYVGGLGFMLGYDANNLAGETQSGK